MGGNDIHRDKGDAVSEKYGNFEATQNYYFDFNQDLVIADQKSDRSTDARRLEWRLSISFAICSSVTTPNRAIKNLWSGIKSVGERSIDGLLHQAFGVISC
jgi:hypothetical protein